MEADAPSLQFELLSTHPTDWLPSSLKVPLNLSLDACFVPSAASGGGLRLDQAHVVVLDGLIG